MSHLVKHVIVTLGRYPAVAGQFYARDATARAGPRWRAGRAPHAPRDGRPARGLHVLRPRRRPRVRGPRAGRAAAGLRGPGPEPHGPRGRGGPRRPPLGGAKYDRDSGARILKDPVTEDIIAHRHEHSIEVQLPFLQDLAGTVRFVPICMGLQDYRDAVEVGGTSSSLRPRTSATTSRRR